MAGRKTNLRHRSRELRRRVVLPARLRTGAHWSDTCILNISSRGLMIHSARPIPKGSFVELRRGAHVIMARVVWKDGGQVGLRSRERVPLEEILSLSHTPAQKLLANRHIRRRRSDVTSPNFSPGPRGLEFVGVCAIAVSLAIGACTISQDTFVKPLAVIAAALGAQS